MLLPGTERPRECRLPLPSGYLFTQHCHCISLTQFRSERLLDTHVALCAFFFNTSMTVDLSAFIHQKKKSILLTNGTEFHSCESPWRRQTHRDRKWMVGEGGGGGGWELAFAGESGGTPLVWLGTEHTEVAQMYLLCELIMRV